MSGNTTVVILAAGLGTRMRSKRAKVLHRAGGLTLVEHVAAAAADVASPDRIVAVTGHQADEVEAVLAPLGISFVRQIGQKGTGHALAACREKLQGFDGLLMVLYGDTPLLSPATLLRLRDLQSSSGSAATLITTTLADPTGYGRVIVNGRGDVTAIVEQKAATKEQQLIQVINSGIYCFRADLLWRHIVELQPNAASGELYLTDMAEILTRHGHRVSALHIEDPDELLGINTRVELADADRVLRERKCRELMLAGVTIERPETVTIACVVAGGFTSWNARLPARPSLYSNGFANPIGNRRPWLATAWMPENAGAERLVPPIWMLVNGPPSLIPIRKPVSGSPSVATSGMTRILVGPFSFDSVEGTVTFWYAGWVNTRLVPPPPPNRKLPGIGVE